MGDMTLFWLVCAVVLGVVEASTTGLVSVWFAAGAAVAAIVSAFGAGFGVQLGFFIGISAVLLATVRPFSKRFFNKKTVATNADRIIGSEGIVILEIDNIENKGQIKVLGQIWSARTVDGTRLSKDVRVEVVALEGVKVIVKPKDNAET